MSNSPLPPTLALRMRGQPSTSSRRKGERAARRLGTADRRALWGYHRDGFAVLEQGILGGAGGGGALSHDAWIAACERRQREVMQRWWGGG